jgi:hypothetical protein
MQDFLELFLPAAAISAVFYFLIYIRGFKKGKVVKATRIELGVKLDYGYEIILLVGWLLSSLVLTLLLWIASR